MIFDQRRAVFGPQQGGARVQQVFDREAMGDVGGGMGRLRDLRHGGGNQLPQNGGINPGGMYTGGPGQQFQTGGNPNMLTGGQLPPMQQPMQTGGGLPPMQTPNRLAMLPWWAGLGF